MCFVANAKPHVHQQPPRCVHAFDGTSALFFVPSVPALAVQAKQAVQPQQILVRPHRSVSHAVVKAHHLLRILVHSYDVPVDAVSSHAERGRRVKRYHPLVAKTCKAAPQHTTIRRHGTTLMQPSNVQWTDV